MDNQQDLDGRLSAYLDGELSEAECAEIESLLAQDEAAAARLELLASAKMDFEGAASEIDGIPMSAGLSDTLDRLSTGQDTADPQDNVIAFPLWRRASRFMNEHRAVAASVAVAAGAMTLQTAIPAQVASVDGLPADGTIYANSEMGQVLQASASGTETRLANGLVAKPRFSFESDGGYCRVVDTAAEAASGRFVACRTENAWRVAVATFSDRGGPSTDAPYSTASQAGSETIERFLDAVMEKAPLGADEEQQVMADDWSGQSATQEE